LGENKQNELHKLNFIFQSTWVVVVVWSSMSKDQQWNVQKVKNILLWNYSFLVLIGSNHILKGSVCINCTSSNYKLCYNVDIAVIIKSSLFSHITACSRFKANRSFGRTCRLCLQGLKVTCLFPASYWFLARYTLQILMMQATRSSETWVKFQWTKRRHIFTITAMITSNLILYIVTTLFSREIPRQTSHICYKIISKHITCFIGWYLSK
jgi:hypothetical protein